MDFEDIPFAVREAALFPYEIVLLGQYEGKDVYGYKSGPDDGRGIGLPHFILFDGQKAEVVYEKSMLSFGQSIKIHDICKANQTLSFDS